MMTRLGMSALLFAFVGTSLALPPVAEAQVHKRKSTLTSGDLKPAARKAVRKQKPPAKLEVADQGLTPAAPVTKPRARQIAVLKRLISATDASDPDLPDLLFRLADLYADTARYWQLQGSKTAADKEFAQAVKVYKRLTESKSFAAYPRMDEALFRYGNLSGQFKSLQQSRLAFMNLIRNYPKSKFIPHAYLAFGDHFFAQNDMAKAAQFYDKVLQFPKSDVYNYALYKRGWVHFNAGDQRRALEAFYKLAQRTTGKPKYQALRSEALKDFVRVYAAVGRAQQARLAFKRLDKSAAFEMSVRLGDIYFSEGEYAKAIYTYRELLADNPLDGRACDWQHATAVAMMSIGHVRDTAQEVLKLVDFYVASTKRSSPPPAAALRQCRDNAEAMSGNTAKMWHREIIRPYNSDKAQAAERLYAAYLKAFANTPEAAKMQLYAAELKWSLAVHEPQTTAARWIEAARAFRAVVNAGKLSRAKLRAAAVAEKQARKNARMIERN